MPLAQPLAWTLPAAGVLCFGLAVAGQKTKLIQLGSEMAGVNEEVLVLSDSIAGGDHFDTRNFFPSQASLIPDWRRL